MPLWTVSNPTKALLRDDYRWEFRWRTGGTQNYKGTKRVDGFTYECSLDYNRRGNEARIVLELEGYSDPVVVEGEPENERQVNSLIDKAERKLELEVKDSLFSSSDDSKSRSYWDLVLLLPISLGVIVVLTIVYFLFGFLLTGSLP